jgi:RNA polymerase sigma-70 factor (ECF subfamily)
MTDGIEETLRERWNAGDFAAVASGALEAYGSEILGFLLATMRDEADASDVFSQTCEDLWRGLEGLQWRASMRTWLYTLARNAAHRHRRSPQNRPSRRVDLSDIEPAVAAVRSRTLPFLRTEVKDDFARIRESLDPDDQALLILRVDRELSWDEITQVFGDSSAESAAERRREAARLRKRFQRIKNEIMKRATDAGLLDGDETRRGP